MSTAVATFKRATPEAASAAGKWRPTTHGSKRRKVKQDSAPIDVIDLTRPSAPILIDLTQLAEDTPAGAADTLCLVCQEPPTDPVALDCHCHTSALCDLCFAEWAKVNSSCPLCRGAVKIVTLQRYCGPAGRSALDTDTVRDGSVLYSWSVKRAQPNVFSVHEFVADVDEPAIALIDAYELPSSESEDDSESSASLDGSSSDSSSSESLDSVSEADGPDWAWKDPKSDWLQDVLSN